MFGNKETQTETYKHVQFLLNISNYLITNTNI